MIEFTRFEAVIPECGKRWDNLTSTEANQVQANFGCANTANMAAQIADPSDIVGPRLADSTDAARRVNVLQKYQKGEITSAAVDKNASGNVSQAVK